MAIELKHNFQSAKADGPDSTVVQPSDWNENHNLTLGAGKILGRAAGTAGAVQELPLSFDSTLQSMIPPTGSTAQRPASPAAGMIRYNSTLSQLEMYRAGAWAAIGGSAYVGAVAPSSPNAGDLWYNTITAQLTTYNGTTWALSTINTAVVTYTGDGSQVTFSLGVSPGSKNNTNVFISGVYQAKANYSVSGTNIIFSTAPPLGAAIEIALIAATTIQVPADGSVTLASIDTAFMADYAQAIAGSSNSVLMTPQRVAESIRDGGIALVGKASTGASVQSLGYAAFRSTADNEGTISSGTYTPSPLDGNMKRLTNGGAFTFAAPAASDDYTLIVQISNNASAGAITMSGFSKVVGSAFTTTNGHDFFVFITKLGGFTLANVVALQ